MKGFAIRYISIFTAGVMLFCMASCGESTTENGTSQTLQNAEALSQTTYTKRPTTLSKKEAVFVTLSSDGRVEEISVTDRLTADSSQVRVDDISSLSNIKNIKGTEQPTVDGQNVVWHMDTPDLYYSGTTEKSLPAELRIEYSLNGKKVGAADIAGKSGRLEIEVFSENKMFQSVEMNGKIMKIYTPFLIVGGLMLTNVQSGVSVTNGTSVGDGQKEIAFGFMLPGLQESLGLDSEKINIPEGMTIAYDADSHEKPQLMFAMIPISIAGGENLLSSVFSNTENIGDSLSQFGEMFSSLSGDTAFKSIVSQSDEIAALADTAMQTVKSFSDQQALIEVLSKHLTTQNAELLSDLSKDLTKVDFSKYAELLSDPAFQSLMSDMGTVSDSISKLMPSLTAFAQDISSEKVQRSIETLPQTMENLSRLSSQLQSNSELLDALSKLSQGENADGLLKVFEAAEDLLKGGTLDALSELSKNSDELMFRFNKAVELGKNYSVFTEAPKDAETSVYFVFKTQ